MEEKIFLARVAEQSERFDDMVHFLEQAIQLKSGEDFGKGRSKRCLC